MVGTGGNCHLSTDPLSMACFLRCLHMTHTEVHAPDRWLIDTPEALRYRTDYMIRTHDPTSLLSDFDSVANAPPTPVLSPTSCATPKHCKSTPTGQPRRHTSPRHQAPTSKPHTTSQWITISMGTSPLWVSESHVSGRGPNRSPRRRKEVNSNPDGTVPPSWPDG